MAHKVQDLHEVNFSVTIFRASDNNSDTRCSDLERIERSCDRGAPGTSGILAYHLYRVASLSSCGPCCSRIRKEIFL
jgi:hypothetical protein